MGIEIVRSPFASALTTASNESEICVIFAISIENDVRLLEFESHPFDNETKKADASIALNCALTCRLTYIRPLCCGPLRT